MYTNNKEEAQRMLGILRRKYAAETRTHVRKAILAQEAKIIEIFPDLGKKPANLPVVTAMPTVADLLANRDVIAVVAHKVAAGIAIAWSHANSGVIPRDVITGEVIDSPHKAIVVFAKSLLAENLAREVVCDLDSFVQVVNSTTKTKTLPQEIDVLRYAIKTGKLIVRRPVAGKGDEFFAKLHRECKRQ